VFSFVCSDAFLDSSGKEVPFWVCRWTRSECHLKGKEDYVGLLLVRVENGQPSWARKAHRPSENLSRMGGLNLRHVYYWRSQIFFLETPSMRMWKRCLMAVANSSISEGSIASFSLTWKGCSPYHSCNRYLFINRWSGIWQRNTLKLLLGRSVNIRQS